MERYAVIKIGYDTYVYDGPINDAVTFTSKLLKVKRQGYGKDSKFILDDEPVVEMELIRDSQFCRTEESIVDALNEQLKKTQSELRESENKRWEQTQRIRDLEAKVATIIQDDKGE
jgi:flagellar motility protein MotE (MotC chaperone)